MSFVQIFGKSSSVNKLIYLDSHFLNEFSNLDKNEFYWTPN